MGRKKKVKWDDPEQSARFLETAKAVQEEGAEERFEKMCEKVLNKKQERSQ
jgi:hypothetical protein